jgi:hypothetical protein
VWSHLPILVNEKHLSLFMAISPKPIRCRRRDWLLTRRSFRTLLLSRLRRVSRLYTSLSATPAYCDSEWIQTIDPYLRRVLLYSAELPNHKHNHFTSASVKDCRANCIYNLIVFAECTGLEPVGFSVTGRHDNQLH